MPSIKFKTIQYLIDEYAGYGTRPADRMLLDRFTEYESGKHLFSRKGAYKFVHQYIERTYEREHGRLPETQAERDTVIRITGENANTMYDLDDIQRMIRTPFMQAKIDSALLRKTTRVQDQRIPKKITAVYTRWQTDLRDEEIDPPRHPETSETPEKPPSPVNNLRLLTNKELLAMAKDITEELIRREKSPQPIRS